MGWPSCCRPGCDGWPAGAELLLCEACIKVPAYVHAEHRRVLDLYKARVREAVKSSNISISPKDGLVAVSRKAFDDLLWWAGIHHEVYAGVEAPAKAGESSR